MDYLVAWPRSGDTIMNASAGPTDSKVSHPAAAVPKEQFLGPSLTSASIEAALDEALSESFPASDPPALSMPRNVNLTVEQRT
jgi:hypothetical protein